MTPKAPIYPLQCCFQGSVDCLTAPAMFNNNFLMFKSQKHFLSPCLHFYETCDTIDWFLFWNFPGYPRSPCFGALLHQMSFLTSFIRFFYSVISSPMMFSRIISWSFSWQQALTLFQDFHPYLHTDHCHIWTSSPGLSSVFLLHFLFSIPNLNASLPTPVFRKWCLLLFLKCLLSFLLDYFSLESDQAIIFVSLPLLFQ